MLGIDLTKTEDRLATLIKQIDILAEELSVTNTLLFYLFIIQTNDLNDAVVNALIEKMIRHNPNVEKYLNK